MNFIKILFIAVGLAMDAFAVSVCKGLSVRKPSLRHYWMIGAWFGGFQMLMPLIGYFLGSAFQKYIEKFDHWIAFALLVLIGINMIREAFSKEQGSVDASFSFRNMLLLAIATSIDALAVGITFALLPEDFQLIPSIALIGVITFLISALGLKIGNLFGTRFKSKAEFAGGVILILIGLQILLEGVGILG